VIITGYKVEGSMIRVFTDDVIGEYVYLLNKFGDLASLEKEISLKLNETVKKDKVKNDKFDCLLSEFDVAKIKEVKEVVLDA